MRMFADFDALAVGDSEQLTRVITEGDLRQFVHLTGDDNPLHVDPAFAGATPLKDVVVHGMLGASFISTVIGTKLPGPGALWLSQSLEFLLPVRVGDELTVSCAILKKHARDRVLELDVRIVNQRRQVVTQGLGRVKVLAGPTTESPSPSVPRTRIAVVTGGAGGIGRAICLRLARDGHHVVVNCLGDRAPADAIVTEIEKGPTRAVAVPADISTPAGSEALVAMATRAFGGVDILVNNASPRIDARPFSDLEWTDFQRHLDVQVKGAFLMARACMPGMVAQRFGRIVNITSQVIDGPPTVTWTTYAVAKGALATLSRYLSAEFGPHGVTVNCVSPGMTDTPLIGDIPEKAQLLVARQTPLRRLAKPEDVASAVSFLASADGSYVTGQTIRVNGGISVS